MGQEDVELDGTTRAPASTGATVIRALGAFAVTKLAIWLTPYGLILSEADQVMLASMVAVIGAAIGTEARNRGWPILRFLFILPLIINLGCASFARDRAPTAGEAYISALTTYQVLVTGMAAYCSMPDADKDTCVVARQAAQTGANVIDITSKAREDGNLTDGILATAALALNTSMPYLEKAQVKK